MKQRGIVVAPHLKFGPDGEVTEMNLIEDTHLRKCALYWDLIDLPYSILDGEFKTEDLDLLRQENVLQETRGHFFVKKAGTWELSWGMFEYPYEYWELVQLYAFNRHMSSDVNWTLGQINTPFSTRDLDVSQFAFVDTGIGRLIKTSNVKPDTASNYMTGGISLELELVKSLPVPSATVPMESVLEFKQKRHDELVYFHHVWDKLILDIRGASDPTKAIEYAKDELELALIKLHKVMDESRIKKIIPSFTASISLDIETLATSAIAGAVVAQGMGLNALIGVIGGATLSALKPRLNLNSRKPQHIPNELMDYAYLYHIETEL